MLALLGNRQHDHRTERVLFPLLSPPLVDVSGAMRVWHGLPRCWWLWDCAHGVCSPQHHRGHWSRQAWELVIP